MSDTPSDPPTSSQPSILLSKLRPPHSLRRPIARARLEKRLSGILHRGRVGLVIAPAGFGKTTLVAQALQQWSHPATWLQLESEDNDPKRFWAYVLRALMLIHPSLTSLLDDVIAQWDVRKLISELINTLAQDSRPWAFVLDNFHEITLADIHQQMDHFIHHAPEALRLLVISRHDPPFTVARLEATHQVDWIRQDDLRFTAMEGRDFTDRTLGLRLPEAGIEHLMRLTEGWPAALHLMALWWQDHRGEQLPPDTIITHVSHLTRFFDEEIFHPLPSTVQEFLLLTAPLGDLDEPLCRAVAGNPTRASPLADLVREQLFTIRLDSDRSHYRYHSLLATYLQDKLRREHPDWLPLIHQRAAAYYLEQQAVPQAIEHLLKAGDWSQAEVWIRQQAAGMLVSGSHVTLGRWLEAAPPGHLERQPRLTVYYAWVLSARGRFEQTEALLRIAESQLGPQEQPADDDQSLLIGEIAILRSEIAHFRNDLQQAVEQAQKALRLIPEDQSFFRGLALMHLGYNHWLVGELRHAQHIFQETFTGLPQSDGDRMRLLGECSQANLLILLGQLHSAAAIFERVMTVAASQPEHYRMPAAIAHISRGLIAYAWNQLETAAELVRRGLELGQDWIYINSLLPGYFILAQIEQARRRYAAVEEALQAAERFIQIGHLTPLQAILDAHRARMRLHSNDIQHATRWAQRMRPANILPLSPSNIGIATAYAEIMIATGQADAVYVLLQQMDEQARNWYWGWMQLEIMLVQTLADWEMGQTTPALARLRQIVLQAEAEGHIRLFLQRGRIVETLLRQMIGSDSPSPYVAEILRCFEDESQTVPTIAFDTASSSSAIVAELSSREYQILKLLEQGATNRAIADQLVIAEGTVKTHIKHILHKLNARTRSEALAKARDINHT